LDFHPVGHGFAVGTLFSYFKKALLMPETDTPQQAVCFPLPPILHGKPYSLLIYMPFFAIFGCFSAPIGYII